MRHDGEPRHEKTAMTHLFGIKYADAIRECGASVDEIVRLSGAPHSHSVTVYDGMKLARHVVPRDDR